MVDSVSFFSSAQSSLLRNSTRIGAARDESASRLSTGRRVNQISDEPNDYLRAKALADRVADLGGVKGDIALGRSTLQASSVGLDSLEQFSRQLKGIASAAGSAQSDEERAAYVAQFNEVRSQIDNLVGDASFLGRNLLNPPPSEVTTTVGDGTNSTLTSTGTDVSVSGLSIGNADSDYNGFASLSDVDAAISAIDSAISTVRATQADYTTDIAVLGVRENFTDELSATLQSGVDQLVNADLNEEAARQLSAQVRSELSVTGQRILAQGDSLILSLFS
jgi:flagellin